MSSKADRDGAIDEILRTTLRADAARATGSDQCIDAETIAAWSDGALPASSAARIETHLSHCSHCQMLLAALVRSAPPTPAASRSIWQRWQLRWVVPIAAAASALALWIAIPADRRDAAPQIAVLDDSRQAAPAPAVPSSVPEQERDEAARNQVTRNLQQGAERSRQRASVQQAPAAAGDTADTAAAAPARDRSAAKAEAPQENTLAPAAVPAPPPPAPAAPPPPALRRELSAEQRAPAVIEATSPDPANRWRIRPRQGSGGQVVDGPRIERSTDSGVSWQAVVFPETTDLIAIRALSDTAAIVTTADNRQFRTDDGGKTWTPVAP